jgi:hypothetical protein
MKMNKPLNFLMIVGVLAVALWAMPVHAAMVAVDDSDLSAISGKSNINTILGSSALTIGSDGSNGNIQVGYFQWDDNHANDNSNHKGANDQSGSVTAVQENVVADTNAISWGAYAAGIYISTGGGTGDVDQEAWATLFIGGF